MVKKMFNEFVLIKKDEAAKAVGDIELLNAIEVPQSGIVLKSFDEKEFPIGARIAFQRNSAQPINLDGESLNYLRKVDIICEL